MLVRELEECTALEIAHLRLLTAEEFENAYGQLPDNEVRLKIDQELSRPMKEHVEAFRRSVSKIKIGDDEKSQRQSRHALETYLAHAFPGIVAMSHGAHFD